MDAAEYTELDRQVAGLGQAFAGGLKRIAGAPAVRRGLLGAAIADLAWTLYIQFPDDRDVLYEELAALAVALRASSEEHRRMADGEDATGA